MMHHFYLEPDASFGQHLRPDWLSLACLTSFDAPRLSACWINILIWVDVANNNAHVANNSAHSH